MRYTQFKPNTINEGGKSDGIRNNTELGVLVAFAGITSGDSNPTKQAFDNGDYDSALSNPASVKSQVNQHLTDEVYNEEMFDRWIGIGKTMYARVVADINSTGRGEVPTQFNWVGGANAGPVADIEFMDNRLSGISLKAESGITLSNLSPKHLGLVGDKGIDIVQFYSELEGGGNAFIDLKRQVMNKVMAEAQSKPGEALQYKNSSHSSIAYNQESNTYNITSKDGKERNNLSAENILEGAVKNAIWQRVFGDWFQENFSASDGIVKKLMQPVAITVAKQFTNIIREHLSNDENLKSVLQIEDVPYYYANDKKLFFVPEFKSGILQVKEVTYMNADGTGQLWKLTVGPRESDIQDSASVQIYIRWRNGLFASNATASAQSLENPEGMAWVPVD